MEVSDSPIFRYLASKWGMSIASHSDCMCTPSKGSWGPNIDIAPDETWEHTVKQKGEAIV